MSRETLGTTVGVAGSLALHLSIYLYGAFYLTAPDIDFEIELPNEIEFGLTDEAVVAAGGDRSPQAPRRRLTSRRPMIRPSRAIQRRQPLTPAHLRWPGPTPASRTPESPTPPPRWSQKPTPARQAKSPATAWVATMKRARCACLRALRSLFVSTWRVSATPFSRHRFGGCSSPSPIGRRSSKARASTPSTISTECSSPPPTSSARAWCSPVATRPIVST